MRDLLPLKLLLLAAIGCPSTGPDDTGDTADTADLAACADAESILLANGDPSGFERCADGAVNRVSAEPVDPTIPDARCRGDEADLNCTADSDCGDGPYGACLHRVYIDNDVPDFCSCSYACASDADCAEGEACVPAEVREGATFATCEWAECSTGDACDSGECGLSNFDDGCGWSDRLTCRETTDTCHGDVDCDASNGESCDVRGDDGFACVAPDCDIGRPLLVEGVARTAPAARRHDWAAEVVPRTEGGDVAGVRALLAAHWATVAALEHASVGSFARFTLQLLAAGAPPELVAATQQAALDEVEHARFAYGLATAYGGAGVGPGPLPLSGAMPALDLAGVIDGLCHEACVGETLGAAEAAAAAAGCADPAVRAGLERIAADEAQHAALAWRALAWLSASSPEASAHAARSLAAAVAAHQDRLDRAGGARGPDLAAFGVPGPSQRVAAQRRALAGVVTPVAFALGSSGVSSNR